MRIFSDITKTIGKTPLVGLKRLSKGLPAQILIKLEFFNPLSSVKDRIGLAMIEDAERDGRLKPGMTVMEPTSGNTGIALAFVCASKGYPLTVIMPETMSQERRTLLLLMGAKVILTPASLGVRGSVAKAMELREKDPNIFIPSQFSNPSNPAIHRETTALEIWQDTDGQVDMIISGIGTGGTFSGCGAVLKAKKPSVRMIAVEPTEAPVISGGKPGPHKIQGIGAGFVPNTLEERYLDGIEQVSSDEAVAMAKRLLKEEGIPGGISTGAAMVAALRQANLIENKGKLLVVIAPSMTDRYLSTVLAEQERLAATQLPVENVDQKYVDQATAGNFCL